MAWVIHHDCNAYCRDDLHCALLYSNDPSAERSLSFNRTRSADLLFWPERLIPAPEAPPPPEDRTHWLRLADPGPEQPKPHAFLLFFRPLPGVAVVPRPPAREVS